MARHLQHRGRPAPGESFGGAFFVATGLHLGLLGGAWMIADDNLLLDKMRSDVPDEPQLLWVDVESETDNDRPPTEADAAMASVAPKALEPETVDPVEPEAIEDEPPEAAEADPIAAVEPEAAPLAAVVPESTPPPPGPESPEWPPASEGYGEGYAPLPGLPGIPGADLGWSAIALAQPDVSGAPAATRAPDAKQADPNIAGQVLSSTLRSRDRELGLEMPAAGVVSSAVSAAVRSIPVPDDTRATFEVRLAPDGRVEHARVVKSTKGNAAMWEQAAKTTAATLASRTLTMSGDAERKGATVVVEVEATRVYPANSKKQVDVKPVCADRVIRDAIAAVDDGRGADPAAGAPKGVADDDSDFCIPVGVAGVGDASNLGAHLQTVVRTKHKVVIDGVPDLPTAVTKVNTDAPWVKRDEKGPRPTLPPKWRKKKKEWEKKNQGKSSGPAEVRPLSPHD